MVEISLSGSGEGPRGQPGGYSTPPQRQEIKHSPRNVVSQWTNVSQSALAKGRSTTFFTSAVVEM